MRGDVEEEVLVLRRRVLGAVRAGVAQHHQDGALGIGLLHGSEFISLKMIDCLFAQYLDRKLR